jgi:hypothetical protein
MPSDWVQRPEWAFSPCGSCSLCMWGLGHIGSLDPADRAFSRLLVRETEGGGGAVREASGQRGVKCKAVSG